MSWLSCGSANTCTAAGIYTDRRGHTQGFVVVERNGRWGKAITCPAWSRNNGRDA